MAFARECPTAGNTHLLSNRLSSLDYHGDQLVGQQCSRLPTVDRIPEFAVLHLLR